jgi:hypothetical protein
LEVVPEPVIYEIPIDVKLFKEFSISEVQTEDVYSQIISQKEICEIPIEVNLLK